MGRIRSIKPEFFLDEDVAQLDPLDRLAFIGLWTCADKAGRLEDRPTRLAVQILPYDRGNFGDRLARLAAARFIVRYRGPNGEKLIQIRSWTRHQIPHHTERPSALPECSEPLILSVTVPEPSDNGDATVTEQEGMVMVMGKVGGKVKASRSLSLASEGFSAFWEGYPRKTGKGAAESAWRKLGPGDREAASAVLPAFAKTWEGKPAEEFRFCPHPSTWLNQRRWEDEGVRASAEATPRVVAPVNRGALVGAHASHPELRPVDEAPEWVQKTLAAQWDDLRPDVPDELFNAAQAWRRGVDTEPPARWEETLELAMTEARAKERAVAAPQRGELFRYRAPGRNGVRT